jgi:hypothetical protein
MLRVHLLENKYHIEIYFLDIVIILDITITMNYTSVNYSFTVTLLPHMYKLNPEIQYDQTYLEVIKLLKGLNSTCSIIAELNKNYCIHYHGVITFHKKALNHMYDFKNAFRGEKNFGYVDIRQITDFPGWVEYLHKDVITTRKLICRPSIILDEKDLFEFADEFVNQKR